jgi:hypothetical protein
MTTTQALTEQAQANRTNAQQSTGPKTEEGKKRAALNAMRHGLTGHIIVLPSEDLAEYKRHTQRFFDEFKPQGALEEQLVQTVSDTAWRLNRVPAVEANILSLGINRHKRHIRTGEPEIRVALAAAVTVRNQSQALANISIYEQRLSRQFHRALDELRKVQAERRATETKPAELAKKEALPLENGFVYSTSPPATHALTSRDREGAGSNAVSTPESAHGQLSKSAR